MGIAPYTITGNKQNVGADAHISPCLTINNLNFQQAEGVYYAPFIIVDIEDAVPCTLPIVGAGVLDSPLYDFFLLSVKEVLDLLASAWVTELSESLCFDLADTLTGYVETLSNFFESA